MKKWTYLSILLMLAGAILFLFPSAREYYYNLKQERLLREAEQASTMSLKYENEQLSRLFQEEQSANHTQLLAAKEQEAAAVPVSAAPSPPSEPAAVSPVEKKQKTIAILAIDKIKLKLPVLEGATQDNMKYAAAHLTGTAKIGDPGNAAIAAHRGRSKGRLFNQLNELEEGDTITLETNGNQFNYTVIGTALVMPDDITVLAGNDEDEILTLITCDPVVNPTHRLIVKAKRAS